MHRHRDSEIQALSDDALMKLLADESPQALPTAKTAFRILFERHGGLVLGYSTRIIGDKALAEDTAQDVWMKVIKSAKHYEAREQLRPWLLTLTRNTSLNALRDRRDWSELDAEETGDENHADTLMRLMEKSESNQVRIALQQLPSPQRTALSLFLIEELSYEEIAQAMTLKLSTVKTHIHRGRLSLIAALSESGGRK